MKKIVINKCFGGFRLSAKALKRASDLMGKECYFFKTDFTDLSDRKRIPVSIDKADDVFITAYQVPNPDEVMVKDKDFSNMSLEERRAYSEFFSSLSVEDFRGDRENPILIQVVEELGKE